MSLGHFKGDWALVTGASSGIGREFARQLATRGMNIAVLARQEDLLQELSRELVEQHGVRSLPLALDLGTPEPGPAARRLLVGEGIRIRLLVNNAAFGRWGAFEDTPSSVYEAMTRVNVAAIVSMCNAFLPDLSSYPSSAVINVSSQAAYQPVPYMAVYAATKAFVQSFSLALYEEWRGRGIIVQALVPGPTATEFDAKAGAYASTVRKRGTPVQVVRAALDRLGQRVPVVASVRGTVKQRALAGLLPPRLLVHEVAKMFRPPSHDNLRDRSDG